jgi:hypothetical protein
MHKRITKRHLEALGKFYRAILVFLAELFFILVFLWLGQSGLLDARTIVSVVVPEVAIAVILYYFLGQGRRGQEEEMSNLLEVAEKLSHLKVYTFKLLGAEFYYVENTATKEYYKAPKQIEQMVELGVVATTECKNEEEMLSILEKNNSHGNEQEPTVLQLMDTKKKRKAYKL